MQADLYAALDLPEVVSTEHEHTNAELKVLENLSSRLNHINAKDESDHDPHKDGDYDVDDDFDIFSNPNRVFVYEGKVTKHSLKSLVPHSMKRYLFLCSDVLIVCKNAGGGMMGTNEKFTIKQTIFLNRAQLQANYGHIDEGSDVDDPNTFRIVYSAAHEVRSYTCTCDNAADKRTWVKHLTKYMIQARASTAAARVPGWQLDTIQGTIFSDALHGQLDGVKRHLVQGIDVNLVDDQGMTALHWASLRGNLPVVDHLIREGADVHAMNNGMNTPLLCAAAGGHDEVFRRLLAAGADIKQCNLTDMDALFMVAQYGQGSEHFGDILETLEGQGVDFNRVDSRGNTVIHVCTKRGLPLNLLVQSGANINAPSLDHLTPLQYLCSGDEVPSAEVIRYLLDAGANPNTKHPETQKTPVQMILDIACKDPNGTSRASMSKKDPDECSDMYTPIMHWTMHVLPAVMELCKKGAKMNTDDLTDVRDSFKEAIGSAQEIWAKAAAGEEYEAYRRSSNGDLLCPPRRWVPDSAASQCQSCSADFTIAHRKHHCRSCGFVVCSYCTNKKLGLTKVAPKPEKVCDACFNRLTASAAAQALSNRQQRRASNMKGGKPASGIEGALTIAGETKAALEERGEKLGQLNEDAEKMESAAMDFHQFAKELNRKEKEKASKNVFGM